MKGLLIKDMYVLKKNLPAFLLVTIGVMVLGVLFTLSIRYGNIADMLEEAKNEPMGEEIFFASYRTAVWAILILPMAFIMIIESCFKEDGRVGFYKVKGILPVTYMETVGARYVACLIMSLVGLCGSLFTGYIVSLATDTYSFTEIYRHVFSFFSFLFIYNMGVMPFYYYFGAKRADTIMVIPLGVIYVLVIAYFMKNGDLDDSIIMKTYEKVQQLLTDKVFHLVGIACLTGLVSFVCSCLIYKRKGEGNQ